MMEERENQDHIDSEKKRLRDQARVNCEDDNPVIRSILSFA